MHLFLRKAAVRIGADDVLTRIDALMDWRLGLAVVFADMQARVGACRDRAAGV